MPQFILPGGYRSISESVHGTLSSVSVRLPRRSHVSGAALNPLKLLVHLPRIAFFGIKNLLPPPPGAILSVLSRGRIGARFDPGVGSVYSYSDLPNFIDVTAPLYYLVESEGIMYKAIIPGVIPDDVLSATGAPTGYGYYVYGWLPISGSPPGGSDW